MSRRLLLLLLLLSLALPVLAQDDDTIGAPGLGDSYFPGLGNGGYDAQHYAITLAYNPDTGAIDATTVITARTTQRLSAFNLDFFGAFFTLAVRVDGAPVVWLLEEAELTVILLEPLAAGQDFTVEVQYAGVPGRGSSLIGGWVRSAASGDVYVAGEPSGASTWYPVNEHPLDKASYSFRITVPPPYVVAANGLLQETLDNADGTRTFVWDAAAPMASYLVTANIGQFYLLTDEGPDGLPIRHYVPRDRVEAARADFADVPEMIAYFSELFGPYPFAAYGMVVVDRGLPFALETQTLALFGRDAITGSGAAKGVIVHELAHQWFGDSVSLTRWQDIWLNEGFATYATALWIEHQGGPDALADWVRGTYDFLVEEDLANRFPPPGDPSPQALFNPQVYRRGALTLHALRLEVGDAAFFDILQTYYARYRDGNAATADFIAVAEEISGQHLDALFDAWLYQPPLPPIPQLGLASE